MPAQNLSGVEEYLSEDMDRLPSTNTTISLILYYQPYKFLQTNDGFYGRFDVLKFSGKVEG